MTISLTVAHSQTQRKSHCCIGTANAVSAVEVKISSFQCQLSKDFKLFKISGDLIEGHLFVPSIVGLVPVAAESGFHKKERLNESQHLWGKAVENTARRERSISCLPAIVNSYLYVFKNR